METKNRKICEEKWLRKGERQGFVYAEATYFHSRLLSINKIACEEKEKCVSFFVVDIAAKGAKKRMRCVFLDKLYKSQIIDREKWIIFAYDFFSLNRVKNALFSLSSFFFMLQKFQPLQPLCHFWIPQFSALIVRNVSSVREVLFLASMLNTKLFREMSNFWLWTSSCRRGLLSRMATREWGLKRLDFMCVRHNLLPSLKVFLFLLVAY